MDCVCNRSSRDLHVRRATGGQSFFKSQIGMGARLQKELPARKVSRLGREAVKVHLEFDFRRIYLRGLPDCEGVEMVQSTGHCFVAACIDCQTPEWCCATGPAQLRHLSLGRRKTKGQKQKDVGSNTNIRRLLRSRRGPKSSEA